MKDRFRQVLQERMATPAPPPAPAKLFWQPLCLNCDGDAQKLYKGSSYCTNCYLEFRRTHNE